MNSQTSWAQHHGAAAVEALIADHPGASADAIRSIANRWHATENLPGFLAACDPPIGCERPPYLAVWIAHPIPGVGYEPWRPLASWAVMTHGAHNLARMWRLQFPGALVAVRRIDRGQPLLPEGMPDHYDWPPYSDDCYHVSP